MISIGTPTALAIADLASPFASDAAGDIDGQPDVVVAFDDGSAEIYLGRGDGGFDPPEQDLVDVLDASELIGIVVDDFDGNGRLDLGLLDLFEEVYFLCNVDGNFAPCVTDVLDTLGQGSLAMVGGDFDHDMHRDLAVLNLDSHDLSPIFGNGDSSFAEVESTIPTSAAGDQEPRDLAVGRLDGDETDDLLVGNRADMLDLSALALYGASDRTFTPDGIAGPSELSALALADLDADGALDFAAVEDGPDAPRSHRGARRRCRGIRAGRACRRRTVGTRARHGDRRPRRQRQARCGRPGRGGDLAAGRPQRHARSVCRRLQRERCRINR